MKSQIKKGMQRKQVLTLAKEIGYFEHITNQKQIELNGQKVNVNEDVFSYANFLLISLLVIEYNSNDIVENITADR
ncbi:hypothetical protein [Aliikangiella sp. IMCC44359]|uniref:hypothetical protein n=1 Tax=Aliikangiella sp. IMCC44359 TaxID=3459125 RepID=UPI00403A9824